MGLGRSAHRISSIRLGSSARPARLYGDLFDPLWGELAARARAQRPDRRRRRAGLGVLSDARACQPPRQLPARRHAARGRRHRCADARLAYVLPVSPPPDIDVEAWHETSAAIRAREVDRLALIHFGVHEDVAAHLDRLEAELDCWAERVRDGISQEAFVELALADAGQDAETYDRVAPFWQSWQGLTPLLADTREQLTRLGPLREREFRLLFAGRTISMLGSAMAPIALAFAVLNTLHGSATQIGIVLAAAPDARTPLAPLRRRLGRPPAPPPRHRRLEPPQRREPGDRLRHCSSPATRSCGSSPCSRPSTAARPRSSFPRAAAIVPQTVPVSMLQSANATLRLGFNSTNITGAALGGPARRGHEPRLGDRLRRRELRRRSARARGDAHSRRRARRRQHRPARAARRLARLLVANVALGDRAPVLVRPRGRSGAVFVLGPEVANADLGGAGAFGLILAATTTGNLLTGFVMLRWRPRRMLRAATFAVSSARAAVARVRRAGAVRSCSVCGVRRRRRDRGLRRALGHDDAAGDPAGAASRGSRGVRRAGLDLPVTTRACRAGPIAAVDRHPRNLHRRRRPDRRRDRARVPRRATSGRWSGD